jgi:hypothetical protein
LAQQHGRAKNHEKETPENFVKNENRELGRMLVKKEKLEKSCVQLLQAEKEKLELFPAPRGWNWIYLRVEADFYLDVQIFPRD